MLCLKVEQKSEVMKKKGNRTFVVGNFIHYATFMSARAYMSSAKTEDDQKSNAETVLKKMVGGRWKSLIKPDASVSGSMLGGFVGAGSYAQENPALDYWNQGASYSYTSKLSIYPWSKEGQGIDLKLTSESWMPREQSEDETLITKGKVESQIAAQVEWDNGY